MAHHYEAAPVHVGTTHHHHDRGSDCVHGRWATDTVEGHHHHPRGSSCVHGLWATDSVNGHHHHKRAEHGAKCDEHAEWATGENFLDNVQLTCAVFSDDPAIVYDLSQSDPRPYDEVAAELSASRAERGEPSTQP